MTSLNLRAAFALFLLLSLLTVPAFAQTEQLTAEPVATEIVTNPTVVEIVEVVPSGNVVTNVYTLIGGAIAVFAAGGVTIGGLLLALATRFRENPAEMAAIESLASSVPGPIALQMMQFADTLSAVGDLIEEAFDRIPAATKTTVSLDDEDTREIGRNQ